MASILDRILEHKRSELAALERSEPLPRLKERAAAAPVVRPFRSALRPVEGRPPRLIAEIKRASPSKGPLAPDLDAADLGRTYAAAGAAALSVLTDGPFFAGTLSDLAAARAASGLPVLRKDFTVAPYHVFEARAAGADAVLLIVAALRDRDLLRELRQLAEGLAMAALVEVHDEAELDAALGTGAQIIGINNRDLTTFHTDLVTTERLAPHVPSDCVLVSESGIESRADVRRLLACGVDALLVGESLVTSPDVRAKIKELIGA